MGKKTRTRRTKWRRLSLGDASGPEEEDDETQPQQLEEQQQEEVRQNVVLHSDEKEDSVCVEHDKKSKFAVVVTTTVNNNNNNNNNNCTTTASAEGKSEAASGGHEEDDTKSAMMVSNHNNQRGPAWKLPANSTQPVKNASGYYNVNNGYQSGSGRPTGGAAAASTANGFRRGANGPRYNSSFNGNYNGYGRANAWNNASSNGYANGDHHHHHNGGGPGLSKMHGIEKKIFNDEEYTKISTPRQEVLFKKGSIGAKKKTSAAPVGSGAHTDSGSEQDSVNGNATSPILPAQGDSADSFQYTGNDSGSTGDASSTAGESAAPCDAAMAAAAASGAALQAGYADSAPLVCFPMYDFYGGYGGMYPGSMLVQTYPGGPIVAAVPVPMPVQAIDWYGGAGGARAASNGDATTNGGEVGYYYALGYPAGSEVGGSSQLPETSSSTRRNSLESYQASSQEVMTSSETGSSSENSSPCQSTGPSSQGPASPQGELVSPAIDPKAQTGGGAATAAAAAAVVMDMTMMSNHQQLDNNFHHHHRKMTVAGFVYPYAAYGLAPPALYASGGGSSEQLCDATKQQLYYYYPDVYYPNAYEQYDVEQGGEEEVDALEEAMDVNADVVVMTSVEEEKVTESVEVDGVKPDERSEQLEGSESNKKRVLEPKETRDVAPATAVANGNAGTGRRKKRRKKRNKTQTAMADALERTESLKLPRPIQPLVRVTDDGAAEDEEEDEVATAEEETLATAVKEEKDAKQEEMTLPAASSILVLVANDPAAPTADSSPHDLLLVEEAVYPPHSSRVEPPTPLSSSPSPHSVDSGQQPQSTPDLSTSSAPSDGQPVPGIITSTTDDAHFPLLTAGQEEPSSLEHCPSFVADPAEMLESPAFCSTPSFPLFSTSATSSQVVPPEEKEESNPTDAAVLFAVQLLSQLLPASDGIDCVRVPSTSTSRTDSFERDSLTGASEKVEEPIDRDSLDGDEQQQQLCDDFVYLHMDEEDKNEAVDVYFEDDEPEGMVLCSNDDPRPSLTLCLDQPQLWRTVILEESEPNSKEMSPLLCSDSGIGAGTPSQSPTPNAAESPNEEEPPPGPITKAVSRWLESAPIEQQLIGSSKSIIFLDNDEEDSDDEDMYFHHQEVEEEESNNVTAPKNGLATLRTAPSSDGTALRRVGSDSALTSDSSDDLLQENGALIETCDPAKFSVYYQLGVSVDQDVVVGDPLAIKSTTLDDCSTQQSSSSLPTTGSSLKSRKKKTSAQLDDGKKKKKKRANSWRHVLLRAAHHKSKSGDDAASISSTTNNRRLKSGSQSCCALQ
ncbi:uncharacterized protein LOC130703653 [Daphnia carinata]|uniref:uncharacterized protein LOC130703653 n=1 Tax=Daphnia carinata TaxID=120202 RepID=UPI00257E42A6|nr:uncharacterized protein LOC130703653 [Daphnia carinata]XP_057381072.1 uncharacterized protein LOC130703653 [Daphnia carinata]